jgi:hypothetical protein
LSLGYNGMRVVNYCYSVTTNSVVSSGLSTDLPWALSYVVLKFIVLTFIGIFGGRVVWILSFHDRGRDVFLSGGCFFVEIWEVGGWP